MPKTVPADLPEEKTMAEMAPAGGQEGLSIEQMTTPQSPVRAAASGKKGKRLGWLILLLVLIGIGVIAFYGRNYVVQIWPGSAALYQSLKIDVETTNTLGLEIHDLTTKTVLQNGVTTLTVTGVIKNVTDLTQPLPRVSVALINADDQHVYSWTTTVEEREVQPWGQVVFSTSMNQPPEEAKNVKVDLIEIGK
ncbi:DUF3426 domain-containing protein [Sneathiella marina]|uniref:DUF3426 domain-containing protein n=1 Tax=Sneathiella marina TaxID=2950108 RepID=A0ABY4W2K5_9PROT|nr:DUF3426 domain-containing protein [Sneathiella marina]USG61066.1 DUF3426 domain-containing protein [Sneathiella marina]